MKKVVRLLVLCLVCTFVFLVPKEAKADSPYLIKVNKQQNTVTIYTKDDNGEYTKPYKAMVCSTGGATPIGSFPLKEKIRWHILDGPVYGQYCTRITGSILFHSVWYYKNGDPTTLSNYQYNRLGTAASHGCVRLTVRDAKWIYDNCPSGTRVVIYNSKNPGPLGKPTAIKLPAGTGYDPTDTTNPNNPYNKKKPSLEVPKGTTITFASDFNILKDVKAKNTTGFDSIKLVTTKIRFKADGTTSFRTVKTVNTKKPGTYKITYTLTDEIDRTVKKTVTHKVLTKVPITSFTLNKSSRTLVLGGTTTQKSYQLKMNTVSPSDASIRELAYVSSDTSVVKVSTKGKLTAKKAGTATITATAKDGSKKKATCVVTVRQLMKSIQLKAPVTSMKIADKIELTATIKPSSTTKQSLTYATSDANIATVSSKGVVTAISAGTVTITATAKDGSGVKNSVTIQVLPDEIITEPVSPGAIN